MLKLRGALCVGTFGSILTLITGIVNDVRPLTILYRVAISAILFCCVGYGLGSMFEKMLRNLLSKITARGKNIDIVAQQDEIDEAKMAGDFTPFTSNNFEHISRPK